MFDDTKFTVKFYESNVWGEMIHPGESGLTRRIAEVAGIRRGCRILDVASGKGESALFLSRHYGSYVVGLDLSYKMVNDAKAKVAKEGARKEVVFLVGEAEILPFLDDLFDVIICECSFSIFTDKVKVAREFGRVLHRGGRVSFADFYIRGENENLKIKRIPFPCINQAETKENYFKILGHAGFEDFYFEDHTKELNDFFLKLIFDFGSINNFLSSLPTRNSMEGNIDDAIQDMKKVFRQKMLGYCLMKAVKF
jgi:ubiquinone/menaquinone biosynthesis C-methylase UbiE